MRRTATVSRHGSCPSFAGSVTLMKDEGAGKAGCGPHPWPPCEQECTGQEPQVWPRHPGLPCTMALTLIRALLGDRLSCPRIATTRYARRAGHQHRDARTTRLHVRDLPFVRVRHARCGSSAATAPRLASRDDRAYAPRIEAGYPQDEADLGALPSGLFSADHLDSPNQLEIVREFSVSARAIGGTQKRRGGRS